MYDLHNAGGQAHNARPFRVRLDVVEAARREGRGTARAGTCQSRRWPGTHMPSSHARCRMHPTELPPHTGPPPTRIRPSPFATSPCVFYSSFPHRMTLSPAPTTYGATLTAVTPASRSSQLPLPSPLHPRCPPPSPPVPHSPEVRQHEGLHHLAHQHHHRPQPAAQGLKQVLVALQDLCAGGED